MRRTLPDGSQDPKLVAVFADSSGSIIWQETTLPASQDWVSTNVGCQGPFDNNCKTLAPNPNEAYFLFVDLNGDGNAEAIQVPVSGSMTAQGIAYPSVAFNNGSFFELTPLGPSQEPGLQGLIGSMAQLEYEFPPSPGSGSFPFKRTPNSAMEIADWNGDGLPDILFSAIPEPAQSGQAAQSCAIPQPPYGGTLVGAPCAISAYTSLGGNGVRADGPLVDTSGNYIFGPIQQLDFDGDGQVDLYARDYNGNFQIFRHAGNKPDQLKGIHDGLLKDIGITYKSIGDTSVYTPSTDCEYPLSCVNRGIWVVSEYSVTADWDVNGKPSPASNPLGTPVLNKFSYTYSRGMTDLRGRGWLGFENQTMTDEQTRAVTTTQFGLFVYDHNNFPFPRQNQLQQDLGYGYPLAGLPLSVTTIATSPVVAPSLATASVTRTQFAQTGYDTIAALGGKGAIVRPNSISRELDESVSSVGNPTPVDTVLSQVGIDLSYDAFNNLQDQKSTWLSGEVDDSVTNYTQNTAGGKWLLSLPQSSVESSTFGGQTVTRTVSYTPDVNTGLLTDEVVEPGQSASLTQSVHYDRNAFGQVMHVASRATDPVSFAPIVRESFVTYDSFDGVFPSSVVNALGHTTRTVYHPGLGVLAFSEDANGVTAQGQYDGFGRPRVAIADGRGTVTKSYTFGHPYLEVPGGPPGLFSIETDVQGGGHSIVTYNALGDEVARGARNHDGTNSYVETEYTTIAGQVVQVFRPHGFGGTLPHAPGGPPSAIFAYDNFGRPIKQTLPDGNVVSTFYNKLATTVIDPRQYSRTRIVDELGRVMRVDEDSTPNGFSDSGAPPPSTAISTGYTYGPFSKLTRVAVTPRGTTTATTLSVMKYDDLGRRTDIVDADRGETVTTYNAFGEPVAEVDGNGQTHILSRDAIGRVFADFSTQDGIASSQWDTAPHGIGMLGSATSADGVTTSYAYDPFARPAGTTTNIAGSNYAVTPQLDAFGRLSAIQYPAIGSQQLTVTFLHDAIGDVSSATGSDAAAPLSWAALEWEADGQLVQESFGQGGQKTHKYDGKRAWLTDIVTSAPAGPVQNLHYDYDPSGNLLDRQDLLLGTSETFQHDFLDRVTGWSFSSSAGSWNTTFNYLDLGNLRSRTTTGTTTASLTYTGYGTRDAAGTPGTAGVHAVTATSSGSYGYDAKGNQTSAPSRTVAFTSFDLPKTVTASGGKTKFKYDAAHGRALKTGPDGSSTLYVGGLYEKRTNASGNVTHVFFVPGLAQVEWTADRTGNISGRKVVYVHDDHLGSVDALSTDSGSVQHLKYDPFGQRIDPLTPTLPAQAPADLTDGFTGQQHDDELGLINMQGRIYDPIVGRFLSADPLVGSPFTSQGFNRYSYVLNRPLSLVDPTGFDGSETKKGSARVTCSAGPGNGSINCDVYIVSTAASSGISPGTSTGGPNKPDDSNNAGGSQPAAQNGEATGDSGNQGGSTGGDDPDKAERDFQRGNQISVDKFHADVARDRFQGATIKEQFQAAKNGARNGALKDVRNLASIARLVGTPEVSFGASLVLKVLPHLFAPEPPKGQDLRSTELRESYEGAQTALDVGLAAATIVAGPIAEAAEGLEYTVTGAETASRVASLRAAIPVAQQGRITMAVGLAEDASGARSVLIGTSEPGGYLRPGVSLLPGEILAPGTGHAEIDVLNYANQNGLRLLEIGATRPVCPGCIEGLQGSGALIVTPFKF